MVAVAVELGPLEEVGGKGQKGPQSLEIGRLSCRGKSSQRS